MVVEDPQSLQTSADQYPQYSYGQDRDQDEEETLSLCDLPIYSDSFKWDDDFSSSSRGHHSSNSSENDRDDDFFEFFSEDFTASNRNYINKTDIVFCGKLIPYKDAQYDTVPPSCASPQVNCNQETREQKSMTINPRKKNSISPYLTSNNNEANLVLMPSRKSSPSCGGFPVGKVTKVSVLASPTAPAKIKPRWYLYMFGMVRFPTEMELRDMRTRQSRIQRSRSQSSVMFPSFDEGKGDTTDEKVSSRSSRRKSGVKGLWGLLRAALYCRSRQAENVAKAAYGCSAVPCA